MPFEVGRKKHSREFDGQNVITFENCTYFPLEERYYRAGYKHWYDEVDKNNTIPDGFSINKTIFEAGKRSVLDLHNLLVHEKCTNTFFLMEDYDRAMKLAGEEVLGSTKVKVLPLACFKEVIIEDIKNLIRVRQISIEEENFSKQTTLR